MEKLVKRKRLVLLLMLIVFISVPWLMSMFMPLLDRPWKIVLYFVGLFLFFSFIRRNEHKDSRHLERIQKHGPISW